jgi:hypothetical protein
MDQNKLNSIQTSNLLNTTVFGSASNPGIIGISDSHGTVTSNSSIIGNMSQGSCIGTSGSSIGGYSHFVAHGNK